MRQPCACHVFTVDDRTYAYDVGQNQVYEVDEALGAVIEAWGDEDRLAALREELGPDVFDRAAAELVAAREEESLFRPHEIELADGDDPAPAFTGTGHLTLGVTEQCNLRCRYCPYTVDVDGDRPHREVHMAPETALAALELVRRPGPEDHLPTISFYGGEPLLNFEVIRQVVAEVRTWEEPHPRFVIDTNGALIDDTVADFIADEGIALQVSLDGPADVHDRWRRNTAGRPTHAEVVSGVRRVLDRDPEAVKRTVFAATLAPPCDLMRVIDYFADFPPYRDRGLAPDAMARVRFADLPGPADAWPVDMGDELKREVARARVAYVAACREGRRRESPRTLLNFFDQSLIRYHHRTRGPLAVPWTPGGCCKPADRNLFVRADGDLQPCERVGAAFTMGSVATGPDMETVARMNREFRTAVAPHCAECWAVRLCDLCFVPMAESWSDDGRTPARIPEIDCEGARRRAEQMLLLHTELSRGGDGALDFLTGSRVL